METLFWSLEWVQPEAGGAGGHGRVHGDAARDPLPGAHPVPHLLALLSARQPAHPADVAQGHADGAALRAAARRPVVLVRRLALHVGALLGRTGCRKLEVGNHQRRQQACPLAWYSDPDQLLLFLSEYSLFQLVS